MNLQDIFKQNITESNLIEISPIVLAFIGDAVHTLFVRDQIVKSSVLDVNKTHRECIKKCNAKAQSQKFDQIFESLSEKEKDIARRARNAKTHHIAKNSDVETYKKATMFEAVIGYLYLLGNYDRLNNILKM